MRNLFCLVVLLTFFFACKETKSPKDITRLENSPKIDTISYELVKISKEFGNCEEDGLKCANADVQLVALKEHLKNPGLANINVTLKNKLKGNSPNIEAALDSFIDEAKVFFEEFEDVATGYAMEVEQTVSYNSPKIITIQEESYSYTGGAHGNYGTSFYNFGVAKGKELTLNELFINGYKLRLKEIAEPIFKKKYLEAGMTQYSEVGFYFDNDEFKLTKNFAITEAGLKFVFNPYEVAPYAMGQQEILLPYSALKGLILPDGLLGK